jgi:uncharacterized damage-inducible protein DinB
MNDHSAASDSLSAQDHILKSYAAYNRWANEQFAAWLREATEAQIHMEIESSFNTLHKTLLHLWNAEHGWLQTLKREPWSSAPGSVPDVPLQALLEGFLKTSADFEAYVHGLSPEDFASTRPFGRNGAQVTVEDIAHHVFNHATYHRGQVITMGRQAGLSEPPRTDYIYYISLGL